MSFLIRPALLNEVSHLAQFQVALAQETEDLQLDLQTVASGIASLMARSETGTYWSLEQDGALVGCMMTLHEWSEWRAQNVLWIHSVYIRPEYRRQGLFRAAYQFLQDKVQERSDLGGLRLYVDRRNQRAQQVYESLGMSAEHYTLYEWLKEH